ncbi:Os12g0163750, partial [Oryza sativa Japonica Group]
GAATGVEGEHGLDGDIHGGDIEALEHDLGHLLPVGLGVERRLGEQRRVLLGRHPELVVEGVVPDLLHVVPVAHDPVLDRVLERQDPPLRLRLVPDVCVLLPHPHHHPRVPGATHDAREHRPRRVVAR